MWVNEFHSRPSRRRRTSARGNTRNNGPSEALCQTRSFSFPFNRSKKHPLIRELTSGDLPRCAGASSPYSRGRRASSMCVPVPDATGSFSRVYSRTARVGKVRDASGSGGYTQSGPSHERLQALELASDLVCRLLLVRRPAAADVIHSAGREAALIGREPRDERGDLRGLADPPHRNERGDVREHLG